MHIALILTVRTSDVAKIVEKYNTKIYRHKNGPL